MKKSILSAALLAASFSTYAITIEVLPSSAPNVFGGPSFPGYTANALNAIENGLSTAGDPSLPTHYSTVGTMHVSQNIVTGFTSWKGVASPGGAFANEYGNRLHFGLHILGEGTQFSISQLGFTLDDTSANGLDLPSVDFPTFGVPGTYTYNATRFGIDYVDGIKGNGNDIIVTGGPNTQMVDELVSVGSGNAWAVYNTVDFPGGTLQEKIDNQVAALSEGGPFALVGTYWLEGGPTASAVVNITVPDAGATALLLGAACLGIGSFRRRGTK